MSDIIEPTILSISEVFEKNLALPAYQRPYKWQVRHVKQLLHDLVDGFHTKKQYRLGTLVLHRHHETSDIVDGQQRLTTLSLVLHALGTSKDFLKQEFSHSISQQNIRSNYKTIKEYFEGNGLKKDDVTKYILENCELVCVELDDLDEAFQFFDSQNARGKSLEPYDLLKAYHLRAMPADTTPNLLQYVEDWERAVNENPTLNVVVSQVLYRLRQWNRSKRAEIFTGNDLQVFKGVNELEDYPYLQAMKSAMALHLAKKMNPWMYRDEYRNPPFQINQVILNGRLFFEYVEHYRKLYDELFAEHTGILAKNGWLGRLEYQGSNRTGDRWLRRLFECAVLMYYDKFGKCGLEAAIDRAFRWVFTVRLEYQSIRWGRIEKTAQGEEKPSLLKCIELAEKYDEVADFTVEKLQSIKYHNTELKQHLGYLNDSHTEKNKDE